MQTAVAPAVAPISSPAMSANTGTAADAAPDSAAAGDFAALLLGQMAGETAATLLPEVDTSAMVAGQDLATAQTTTPTDPAQLLAAMGLVLEPPRTQPSTVQTDPAADAPSLIGTAITGTTLDPAKTGPQGHGAAPELAANDTPGSARLPATHLSANTPLTTAAPANFAAVEQKLAESVMPAGEAMPQMVSTQAPQQMPARPMETLALPTPVKDPAWAGEFGQKVVWMATQDKQSAQITLNPPQMGPIEISLSVKNDQATAVFVSTNAEVREVIEAAVPRLREMLAGVGVELGQTNVSAESFRQAQDNHAHNSGRAGTGNDRENSDGDRSLAAGQGNSLTKAGRSGNGLVDTFA